ncbi:hypothetical protein TNCV_4064551 [Trichonephila clavipes]|nr:hypothetical protein TNCV_4064551 [Trichonephila clavipes]
MSVEIMALATKVLQSKSEVRLDEGFNIEIITIRRPVGSEVERCRLKVFEEKRLLSPSKTCNNIASENWCVPQGPCGFEEIALFEDNT